jgi:hypothetical protein
MAVDIIGSKMPSFASDVKAPSDNRKTGYGQNGYMGASSDTDLGNPTRSALSVDLFPNPQVVVVDQTRILPSGNVPDAVGMASARARQPTARKVGI